MDLDLILPTPNSTISAAIDTGGQTINLLAEEQFNERVRIFTEFLEDDYSQYGYKQKIMRMLQSGNSRLIVNINHVRQFNKEYASGLIATPVDYLPAFDKALKDICALLRTADMPLDENAEFYIGLEGSFGENFVTNRTLGAKHLGQMICIEGIVTKCSLVRPKVVKSIHYCEKTQVFHSREYRDGTSLSNALPTGSVYPKEDENGNPLVTEFGLSVYRAHQTASLQEMPERAPAGQLPRPIDMILDDDLSDQVKPGDRVSVVGVYRSVGKHAASVSATFRSFILVNNIKSLGANIQTLAVTDVDIQEIKKIAKRSDCVDLLAKSLAPSIYGHDFIKKAVLLLLLGGLEKNLENGTHIRGDINILMIGDPSTAKSQMLRFVLNIAPLAIATTGRGSSGVGLTAAVTSDKETGERRLEAGAMVLADRGVVCIDEFDKMSDIDRVAIHEVMEQQTVTIAKAGIHTSLNARCSVIAAANPAYGQYVSKAQPTKNINLPDSLLSRFDLLFIVLDNLEDEHNRAIAEHVVRLHRFVPAGLEEGAPVTEQMFRNSKGDDDDEEEKETAVFEKYNPMLHVGLKPSSQNDQTRSRRKKKADKVELLSVPFIKKYVQYAKNRMKPVLTPEASELICDKYSELRNREDGQQNLHKVMPITARTLETLVRLSTAHAKARLSPRVERADAEAAMEILVFALYAEVKPKEKRDKRRKVDEDDEEEQEILPTSSRRNKAVDEQLSEEMSRLDTAQDEDATMVTNTSQGGISELVEEGALTSQRSNLNESSLDMNRMEEIKKALHNIRQERIKNRIDEEALSFQDALNQMKSSLSTLTADELTVYLRHMSQENLIWFQEDSEQIFML